MARTSRQRIGRMKSSVIKANMGILQNYELSHESKQSEKQAKTKPFDFDAMNKAEVKRIRKQQRNLQVKDNG